MQAKLDGIGVVIGLGDKFFNESSSPHTEVDAWWLPAFSECPSTALCLVLLMVFLAWTTRQHDWCPPLSSVLFLQEHASLSPATRRTA